MSMHTEFPAGFLWGTATAAHQVEGNNINSDFWVMEHAPGTIFQEPSGDACDHYRLYCDDIQTLKDLGFNAYRFSIEWARVEPADGSISKAALRHYADVLATCHEYGITPIVTLHHCTSPRWRMKLGGWESAETPKRFEAYTQAVMRELGSLIPYVCTINEANIAVLLRRMNMNAGAQSDGDSQAPIGVNADSAGGSFAAWMQACAQELNTPLDKLKTFLFTSTDAAQTLIRDAHARARDAIKSANPATQVGITLALNDVQTLPGGEALAATIKDEQFFSYLPACADDDFIGVQNYTRQRIGAEGVLPNEAGVETTQMGYEYYPEALEGVIRMVAAAGKPMIVTENGLSTEDDSRRVAFIQRALAGVRRCLDDRLDVRGYVYWSALDNFEWVFGYRPKFGLIDVDRATQQRRVKESGRYLGNIARRNALGE